MNNLTITYYPGGGFRLRGATLDARLNEARAKRFYAGLPLLAKIAGKRPASVYALARDLGTDVSNLRKTLALYEKLGLVAMNEQLVNGRKTKIPELLATKIEVSLSELETKTGRRPGLVRRRRP